jgi:hypothetical protein
MRWQEDGLANLEYRMRCDSSHSRTSKDWMMKDGERSSGFVKVKPMKRVK